MTGVDSMATYQPRLRPGVLISGPLLHGPRTVHLVKNPDSGDSFEVGPREGFLMGRMDGSRTLAEIGAEYAGAYRKRLGDGHWRQLLGLLGTRGLLDGAPAAPAPAEGAAARRAAGGGGPRLLSGSYSLVSDPDATAARLYRVFGFLLRPVWMVPLLLLVAGMETVMLLRADELLAATGAMFTHPVLLMGAATLLWLSTALHELAHGVAARHYGGTVGEIGLRWRMPVIMMYCTVENYPYLSTRWARIVTALAGAVMNLLFLLPFFALWQWAPVDAATADALGGLLVLGTVQALAMLLPLPPLDGYKIVSQAAGATGLAGATRTFWTLAARRDPALSAYPRRARVLYTAYGLGAALTVCALLTALVLLARTALTA
ncbi:hypothetical protein GCM10009716_17740 [Streptomyces sodiiphilus]|uniref:Peptidase M50 domain-containing protein n=2 Tax=Streptomyces sodiiphilus TaxID=226217 RepID=A0ABN2P3N6_9ACTN